MQFGCYLHSISSKMEYFGSIGAIAASPVTSLVSEWRMPCTMSPPMAIVAVRTIVTQTYGDVHIIFIFVLFLSCVRYRSRLLSIPLNCDCFSCLRFTLCDLLYLSDDLRVQVHWHRHLYTRRDLFSFLCWSMARRVNALANENENDDNVGWTRWDEKEREENCFFFLVSTFIRP